MITVLFCRIEFAACEFAGGKLTAYQVAEIDFFKGDLGKIPFAKIEFVEIQFFEGTLPRMSIYPNPELIFYRYKEITDRFNRVYDAGC